MYVHLRWIDKISAALIVNFVWGTPPIPPVILKGGWVAPSKLKFKQHLTTSFCWPSHDVTRGVYISLHLEFRSSWTSCNIWVAFRKQFSLYSCNFEDTVNATFCCVTSISMFSVKATSMLQFEQLDIHISCCRQATIELCTLQRQKRAHSIGQMPFSLNVGFFKKIRHWILYPNWRLGVAPIGKCWIFF